MELTDEQRERYARHISISEVGETGQLRLIRGRVLIVGAGGLGSPAAMYLAAAGVGTIGIADADAVSLTNLQRQIIHTSSDVGKLKTVSARETMEAINPEVTVHTYNMYLTARNIADIINEYDFVIDASDNFETKFLINDACVAAGKPFSHAGVIRFEGQLMTYVPGMGPCYRCVFKNPPPEGAVPGAKQVGIMGVTAGVIGTLQATEAIKYLLGEGELFTGCILTYNALTAEFRKIKLPGTAEDCPVCSAS